MEALGHIQEFLPLRFLGLSGAWCRRGLPPHEMH